MEDKYTCNGTIFCKEESVNEILKRQFAVQVDYKFAYGGAPFKTIKWVTWENTHMPLNLQETNEDPNMYGWKIVEPAELILFATKEQIEIIKTIKGLVELGYKGRFSTPSSILEKVGEMYGEKINY